MNRFFTFTKTNHQKILLVIVFTLAVLVRFWKIEYLPFQSDWDEYAYIFAGQTLIETRVPTSISTFTHDYNPDTSKLPTAKLAERLDLNIKGSYVLVEPWFDHPPLLPLITGGWVKLFGYSFPSHIPSLIYRLPMLFFSGLTLYLIFLISKHFFKFYGGLFSLIIFGFSPSLIIIQRMVVSENLFIPFLLLTLYLALKQKSLFPQIIFTVIAGLSKVTGLATIPIVGFYYLLRKEYQKTFIYVVSSLVIFVALYGFYGYLIDWPQFIQMLKTQSFRLLGWTNPAFLLSHPGFHQKVILDMSYYLILFLGLGSLLIKDSLNNRFLSFSIFGSLILVWLTSMETAMLGWYKLPFFIFLSIAAGQLIKLKNKLPLFIFLAITLLNNYGLIRYTNHPFPEFWPFRLVISLILGSFFILSLLTKLKQVYQRIFMITLLTLYVLLSFYVIDKYYQSICENKLCPLPMITFKQVILLLPKSLTP
jgi:hypothetical protein